MQPKSSPFEGHLIEGFESPPRVLFFLSLLLVQGGGMDLSKVGEKILSSVRSARSLGFLPTASDRPEVPARAAAAAAVARAIAGLPPHQRLSRPSSSEGLVSIYGSIPRGETVEELEEGFYEEDFDPVRHVIMNIPSEENNLTYFEKQACLRLAQLDKITECLSHHVMEHHEEMVKGMHLVRELELDLKIANVICMNGRRHLNSSMQEVSRDLVVTSSAKKKQALLDMLPILIELRHAVDLQVSLENHVEEGNYFKAFQVLSEYLQVLDSFSDLSAIQGMSRGVEGWLARTLQKLDSLLLGVCREFKEENYITVVDAYALIGDIAGLAEKIQSFFMQEVLSETHAVLKHIVQEGQGIPNMEKSRLTYSDLCLLIPESKFRLCLLRTLGFLFKLMCSYYSIMSFHPEEKDSECQTSNTKQNQNDMSQCSDIVLQVDSVLSITSNSRTENGFLSECIETALVSSPANESARSTSMSNLPGSSESAASSDAHKLVFETRDNSSATSSSGSSWDHLQKDAMVFVSQTLQRGRKNLWQLTTSRISVLLSISGVCSTSVHQFLKIYEDLNVFILAGETFCGVEAIEFRLRLKTVCENYFAAFHRQNLYALKMVLEKETWLKISSDTVQVVSFAGLVGDGAAIIIPSDVNSAKIRVVHSRKSSDPVENGNQKNGFAGWVKTGNPFLIKLANGSKELLNSPMSNEATVSGLIDFSRSDRFSPRSSDVNDMNGNTSISEDENEDLLADFIDEDSQLPSRISKPKHSRSHTSNCNEEDITAQTGSSLCLLRLMDKYARLMQKLEIVNIEFFKGICQLFEVFFRFVYETFGQRDSHLSGKVLTDSLNHRLKTALARITQDCDQWIKPQTVPFSSSSSTSDVTPTSPPSAIYGHPTNTSFGLKERCAGAETISLVAQILYRSKSHLQSMLLQNNVSIVEDFYTNLVDCVPDLIEHIHRTSARLLLHIDGYVDRISNARWEPKELGLEHNGYVDLLLGEFKHYKTRLAHGGIHKEVEDLLLEYGLENVAETLIEGLSRVKRCTDEGRALMSLDLQVLINGLQHFASVNVKPKLQIVETFIKAYYLPETEYVYWARAHPEFSKAQIIGLINLVATMKSWKRKTRLEVLEKIEASHV